MRKLGNDEKLKRIEYFLDFEPKHMYAKERESVVEALNYSENNSIGIAYNALPAVFQRPIHSGERKPITPDDKSRILKKFRDKDPEKFWGMDSIPEQGYGAKNNRKEGHGHR